MAKRQLALMFGGASPEHEVSIRSARNIFSALDRGKYDIHLIGIDKTGRWFHIDEASFTNPQLRISEGRQLMVIPGQHQDQIQYVTGEGTFPQIEVVFPITHGPYGEDGTLQGLLRHLYLPFVGPDVAGSAVSMDKDLTKRLLRDADLLVAAYHTFYYYEQDAIDYIGIVNQLGTPLFIKPANMGSSVGVAKAENKEEFDAAVAEAFRYDHKIIVEECLYGRELECAVLGNGEIAATSVGEVGMSEGFYTYDAKYISETDADILIPAPDLDDQILAKLILVAKSTYRVLGCEGMTRVDMFLDKEGRVYINEVNTLPGFTSISMYPKLWEHAGTSYSELIDELINLALERGEREAKLEKSR